MNDKKRSPLIITFYRKIAQRVKTLIDIRTTREHTYYSVGKHNGLIKLERKRRILLNCDAKIS
jgi:hypothetical protein